VLERTGLSALLDGVVSSAEVGVGKPDTRLFAAALAVAGANPGEALHVGDSFEEDVEGALAAGVGAVWLRRQAVAGERPRVRVIASLDELP